MLTLRMHPGLIARHTIVINNDLAYDLQLTKSALGANNFHLTIYATTTLGTLTIARTPFTDLDTAHHAFTEQVRQLG